ncbi:hypothetical protein TYRP_017048 [Tyrophagus putrescentiae]|nr:hypothetical protein TYRP_017048 [Tyrophagus putrescentiae]
MKVGDQQQVVVLISGFSIFLFNIPCHLPVGLRGGPLSHQRVNVAGLRIAQRVEGPPRKRDDPIVWAVDDQNRLQADPIKGIVRGGGRQQRIGVKSLKTLITVWSGQREEHQLAGNPGAKGVTGKRNGAIQHFIWREDWSIKFTGKKMNLMSNFFELLTRPKTFENKTYSNRSKMLIKARPVVLALPSLQRPHQRRSLRLAYIVQFISAGFCEDKVNDGRRVLLAHLLKERLVGHAVLSAAIVRQPNVVASLCQLQPEVSTHLRGVGRIKSGRANDKVSGSAHQACLNNDRFFGFVFRLRTLGGNSVQLDDVAADFSYRGSLLIRVIGDQVLQVNAAEAVLHQVGKLLENHFIATTTTKNHRRYSSSPGMSSSVRVQV